jgi:hypothetical protein
MIEYFGFHSLGDCGCRPEYPQLRGHGPISRRPVEQMAFIDS